MHPAPSVIFFTVASGLGFGLMAWLGLGFGTTSTGFAWVSCFVAGLLAVAGLVSSTFHLGHPERVMKALSQWRSSWLSREGVLAAVLLVLFGIYFLLWAFFGYRSGVLGFICTLLSVVTVYATSMIYAQLKTVPRWNSPWTPVLYGASSLAGGMVLLVALDLAFAVYSALNTLIAVACLAAAAAAYWLYRTKALTKGMADSGAGTPESATGLGFMGRVSLLEAPHSAPNYLMKEMVFEVARRKAAAVAKVAVTLAFAVPFIALLLLLATQAALFAWIAVVCHFTGMLASRWLFFAEAEHVVGLYYGKR